MGKGGFCKGAELAGGVCHQLLKSSTNNTKVQRFRCRWGDRTADHSTNPLPYSQSLGKKKKFQRNLDKKNAAVRLQDPDLKSSQVNMEGGIWMACYNLALEYLDFCLGDDLVWETFFCTILYHNFLCLPISYFSQVTFFSIFFTLFSTRLLFLFWFDNLVYETFICKLVHPAHTVLSVRRAPQN